MNVTPDVSSAMCASPLRGTGSAIAPEATASADADGTRHSEVAMVHVNPLLLFRRAERDEQDVGLCGADARGDFIVIEIEQLRVGRRVNSADLQTRKAGVEPGACFGEHVL